MQVSVHAIAEVGDRESGFSVGLCVRVQTSGSDEGNMDSRAPGSPVISLAKYSPPSAHLGDGKSQGLGITLTLTPTSRCNLSQSVSTSVHGE